MINVFTCLTCEGINKHHFDSPGFERHETRFELFSDAWKHMLNNPDHYMTIDIIDNDDNGDEE